MELLFPLLIVFMIGMIFVSNRQRRKQAAQQESLQNALTVGDIVVMTSGISGTVVDVDDDRTIDVEIAPDVVTTWLRAAVREKIGGEPTDTVADESTSSSDAADAGVPAPALETTVATAGTESTAEGTSSVRADEPDHTPSTAQTEDATETDTRTDTPTGARSTTGGSRS